MNFSGHRQLRNNAKNPFSDEGERGSFERTSSLIFLQGLRVGLFDSFHANTFNETVFKFAEKQR